MSRHLPGAPVLTVIEAYSGDLRNLMAAGQLDLALSYGTQGTEGVRETLLLSERLVVATRTAPPEARMTLRQIAGLKLILPSRIHQLRRIIDAICAGRGQPLTPVLELDSLSAVRAMLRQEPDYSTILPYHAVAADEADPGLDPVLIDDPDMVRRIALLQPERGVALPEGLVGAIRARAEDIRKTMEAVC
jgi:LysR family nitrogen assimilation transcriptional regulator